MVLKKRPRRRGQEEEAKNKAYSTILPKLQKGLTEYLSRSSTVGRKNEERPNTQTDYMKTKDAFVNEDNFDPEETLEAAVDKRKVLLKRLFGDTRSTKARFPLGEFVRATRSENKNLATWLVDEAANFFANQSRCWILVFASRRANKFA